MHSTAPITTSQLMQVSVDIRDSKATYATVTISMNVNDEKDMEGPAIQGKIIAAVEGLPITLLPTDFKLEQEKARIIARLTNETIIEKFILLPAEKFISLPVEKWDSLRTARWVNGLIDEIQLLNSSQEHTMYWSRVLPVLQPDSLDQKSLGLSITEEINRQTTLLSHPLQQLALAIQKLNRTGLDLFNYVFKDISLSPVVIRPSLRHFIQLKLIALPLQFRNDLLANALNPLREFYGDFGVFWMRVKQTLIESSIPREVVNLILSYSEPIFINNARADRSRDKIQRIDPSELNSRLYEEKNNWEAILLLSMTTGPGMTRGTGTFKLGNLYCENKYREYVTVQWLDVAAKTRRPILSDLYVNSFEATDFLPVPLTNVLQEEHDVFFATTATRVAASFRVKFHQLAMTTTVPPADEISTLKSRLDSFSKFLKDEKTSLLINKLSQLESTLYIQTASADVSTGDFKEQPANQEAKWACTQISPARFPQTLFPLRSPAAAGAQQHPLKKLKEALKIFNHLFYFKDDAELFDLLTAKPANGGNLGKLETFVEILTRITKRDMRKAGEAFEKALVSYANLLKEYLISQQGREKRADDCEDLDYYLIDGYASYEIAPSLMYTAPLGQPFFLCLKVNYQKLTYDEAREVFQPYQTVHGENFIEHIEKLKEKGPGVSIYFNLNLFLTRALPIMAYLAEFLFPVSQVQLQNKMQR